ncbi:Hsp70 family protein [Ketobacter sp.]|uniref:Hsp70 family protein n=1 Tax=Ketobacter sp. TaxID=2083498 RepID=UPI000F1B14F7|nr:Hsp70 family protein [Ketobacter sp.]RLT98079.1 MAG: molecular chaperone DnaK [Ketobacter sp.]
MSETGKARYLVGIDLGTTHTVVSYADLSVGADRAQAKLFEIEQLIGPGEVAKRPLLPSFRYHPAAGELPEEQLVLPWPSQSIPGDDTPYLVGEYARDLGSKVEGRQIASAKSWLSHGRVERSAPILPWAAAEGVAKVSPVVASASYLLHIRCAWNHEHPDAPLDQQTLVITVPASFDEAARSLTLQAAELAGLPQVTLLEEPQAVCYDWYFRHGEAARTALQGIHLLLVLDVGGGTTDLSLIQVQHQDGKLQLNRIAVGDHWMLGGDNVDLALARMAEQRITSTGKPLSAASLSQLIQQSRSAKELLLGEPAPASAKVTLVGGGARLIGGAKSAEFSQQEVRDLALEGFFPLIDLGERPRKRSGAIVEFGLPYAPDPAVSKYISQFLSQHQAGCRKALSAQGDVSADTPAVPDALLMNGGVFNSKLLTERAQTLLSQWRGAPVTVLENRDPHLAVAFGAVAFGLSRATNQMRIGGGSARSYFLKVDAAAETPLGVCILPKGSEEGDEVPLADRRFALQVNQPVQFSLVGHSGDAVFAPGELVELDLEEERFQPLPPLVAALDGGSEDREVEVALVTRLTEVGTLDIQCRSVSDPQQRWQVEFQLRRDLQSQHSAQQLPAGFKAAVDALEAVFGANDKDADKNAVKQLRQQLEKKLGERKDWDTALARALFDELWSRRKKRRRSQAHERLWFNLAGFCLRPGFGYPADDWRIQQAWGLYQQGLQFEKENQSWAEWWTFWRRAAGGLDVSAQKKLFKDISKFINPASARNLKIKTEIKNKSYEDMVRLAASLEGLPVETKVELANWLAKRLEKSSETQTSWWALGRIAAREPFHSGVESVVPPQQAQTWCKLLLSQDWKKNSNAAFAAVMIARCTGDRARDLPDTLRSTIIEKLRAAKAPELWQTMVEQKLVLDDQESKLVFGEALPVGLKLLAR